MISFLLGAWVGGTLMTFAGLVQQAPTFARNTGRTLTKQVIVTFLLAWAWPVVLLLDVVAFLARGGWRGQLAERPLLTDLRFVECTIENQPDVPGGMDPCQGCPGYMRQGGVLCGAVWVDRAGRPVDLEVVADLHEGI